MRPALALLCVLPLLALPAGAAPTRYVSDDLTVPLRDGPSRANRVLRHVKAGTPVRLLLDDRQSGYSAVEVNGKEGWIANRYLQKRPGARQQVKRLEQQVARLEADKAALQARLDRLTQEAAARQQALDAARQESERLQQALQRLREETSDVVAINRRNARLGRELRELQQRFAAVQQDNERLRDRTARDWFLRGAGVVVGGILLGLILPRLRLRRRDRWSDSF